MQHGRDPLAAVERLKQTIIDFRQGHDRSQIEFATDCGVSSALIRNIEQERMDKLPKLDTLSKIAAGLGTDVITLMGRLNNLDTSEKLPQTKGRVLVVDDEPDIVHSYVLSIERLGYVATGVSSGQLALSAFNYCRPDVVLLDVKMAGMNGLEVARQLRRECGFSGKIFLVTASDVNADEIQASGVDRVFHKHAADFSIRSVAACF
ncbi:MAG: response regulator [Candidatus Sericytochromatia bacterium]|nr:response regulator [Candidatus Sericytochromatia bacterium]